jgi:hypothetical protein
VDADGRDHSRTCVGRTLPASGPAFGVAAADATKFNAIANVFGIEHMLATAAKPTMTTVTVAVYDDQKATIAAAIAKAKAEAGCDSDGVALEGICLNYLSGGNVAKPQSLLSVIEKYTPGEVLPVLEKVFPDFIVSVLEQHTPEDVLGALEKVFPDFIVTAKLKKAHAAEL